MTNKRNCAVLIPIYKSQLDEDEMFSVKTSLSNLQGYDIHWIAPEGIDLSFYNNAFGVLKTKFFQRSYFRDVKGYSKLLTSTLFYTSFLEYEFCLICQPDAIVLSPRLQEWLEMPYDYIGAPWPDGYSLQIETKHIPINEGIKCTSFVGNGGLSLRRTKACIDLINEFDDIAQLWRDHGHAEDLFFSFCSQISKYFRVPNLRVAAQFSFEKEPEKLYQLNDKKLPFGAHAWNLYSPDFWRKHLHKDK